MLLQLERPPVEGARHVEGGVAVFEAAVAERQHDLALRHDTPVEIGDAMVRPRAAVLVAHERPPSNNGARLSANSSTAATSLPESASSSAIDSAIMPRLANPMQSATRSKYNRSRRRAGPGAAAPAERSGRSVMCTPIIEPMPVNCIARPRRRTVA